ncbi:LysR family transcriptional regulator [Noviherbaspirillum sp.]|uniref:LysR family transcriptional regulator n=1 Tax=Noviherbaspirillum sp. TaxID=1926288 RepID=UPI002FE2F270
MDWNALKAFYFVADRGSLTRAASLLGVSQPTLSRQIATLESTLGVALFERLPRGLKPTEAGTALLEPVRRMLGAAQGASIAATVRHEAIAGTVRLTASEIMSAYVLPPILVRLRAMYPAVQIELVASNAIDNLLTREADIAIRMVRPKQQGVVTRKVAQYELGFFARRDYLALHHRISLPQALEQLDWVGFDQSNQLIEGFRQAGFNVGKSLFVFRTDNQIVGWQAVLAGLGAGIGMKHVARQFPQLQQILENQALPELPVWLTAHRELRSVPRIRAVFDFLADALAGVSQA